MIGGYQDTLAYATAFSHDYGQPPTLIDKRQHLRSITQAMLNKDDRFELDPWFAELGRVAFVDRTTQRRFLLRSSGAVEIETKLKHTHDPQLFPTATYIKSDDVLLVYRFHKDGLDLSVGGTQRMDGKGRLRLSGTLTFIATWHYSFGGPTGGTFNQFGNGNPFDGLGDLGIADGEVG